MCALPDIHAERGDLADEVTFVDASSFPHGKRAFFVIFFFGFNSFSA